MGAKFEYDLAYIDNGITFIGDLEIVLKTVGKVIKREDTVREGTVSDMDFGEWLLLNGNIEEKEYNIKQTEARELLRA